MQLQLTNIQANYWASQSQIHCGPPNQNSGWAMAYPEPPCP